MSVVSQEWKLYAACQQFSLPEALTFYIARHPFSVELYNKLIKCCKYFWLKNPVITFDELVDCRNLNWRTRRLNGFPQEGQFKMTNVNARIWIYENLSIFDNQNKFMAKFLIPKIYRCNLNRLNLSYQSISFDEFKVFTSSSVIDSLSLNKTIVKDKNGTIIPIETLVELLPSLQKFEYNNVPDEEGLQTITSETAANLIAIPHFLQIKKFFIREIPEPFEFEVFFAVPKVRS